MAFKIAIDPTNHDFPFAFADDVTQQWVRLKGIRFYQCTCTSSGQYGSPWNPGETGEHYDGFWINANRACIDDNRIGHFTVDHELNDMHLTEECMIELFGKQH